MSQQPRCYEIKLQPDPNRNIHDPGTQVVEITLTPDQVNGIANMRNALYPINFQLSIDLDPQTRRHLPPRQQHFHLNSQGVGFISADHYTQLMNLVTAGTPWLEAIQQVLPFAVIRNRYTVILWSQNNDFGNLFEFNTPEFLQGAISLCQWLRLNWRDYISNIHDGDTPMNVMNI